MLQRSPTRATGGIGLMLIGAGLMALAATILVAFNRGTTTPLTHPSVRAPEPYITQYSPPPSPTPTGGKVVLVTVEAPSGHGGVARTVSVMMTVSTGIGNVNTTFITPGLFKRFVTLQPGQWVRVVGTQLTEGLISCAITGTRGEITHQDKFLPGEVVCTTEGKTIP